MMREPGAVLAGRYRLDELIGAGGMGEVWRATDQVLRRTVAVKLMLPSLLTDADFSRRFRAEARAMASVHHSGVVPIHDYHSGPDGAFLIMAFIEGESLSGALGRHGRLSAERTMTLVAEAADALQAVHDRGVVHRDIKPGNLLLDPTGAVVLTDFGIARQPDATQLTATGALLGTPAYLAPEQVLGQPATPQSDVYALGVVAYECLTGRRPFEADSPYAVALQRVQEPPAPLGPEVPVPVRAVVEQALAADPAQRWPSAAALAAAARQLTTPGEIAEPTPSVADRAGPTGRAAAGSAPTGSAPAGSAPRQSVAAGGGREQISRSVTRSPRYRRRRALLVGTGGLALVLVGVFAASAWTRGETARTPAADDLKVAGGGTPAADTEGASAGDRGGDSIADQPSGPGAIAAAAGLVPCGDLYCPPEPMCWGGLVEIAGVPHPPRQVDCDEPHYWETYAVLPLDDLAEPVYTDVVAERTDVQEACTAEVAAAHSREPATIEDWAHEAWPIPVNDHWLVHCLATSGDGESTGNQFHP